MNTVTPAALIQPLLLEVNKIHSQQILGLVMNMPHDEAQENQVQNNSLTPNQACCSVHCAQSIACSESKSLSA
jgi:hypothetical protein